MQISKEFLETEIADLQSEVRKVETFLIQAQATISAYQMLVRRLDTPEPVEAVDTGDKHG
jgi:Tfp pilus assembly protein PilN